MTSLAYGLDVPYEVQLVHDADTSQDRMVILEPQRSPGIIATRHLLTPGVYMVSMSYNGASEASLLHEGRGRLNTVPLPAGKAGIPRTSTPIKISVEGTNEYLQIAAPPTGGSARATISVIPAATFDEMAESTQGVSVLSEISNLQSTKADKSTLDARVPADTSLRLDTRVGTRIFAGNTMIYGDTGRRLLVSWDEEGNVVGTMPEGLEPAPGYAGHIAIRREMNLVTMYIRGASATAPLIRVQPIQSGFSSSNETWELAYARVGTSTTSRQVTVRLGASHVTFDGLEVGDRFGTDQYHVTVRWAPSEAWPTTLPGLPA